MDAQPCSLDRARRGPLRGGHGFARLMACVRVALACCLLCGQAAAAHAAENGRNAASLMAETVPGDFSVAAEGAPSAASPGGVDAQGRAAWRELEPGLLYGEFQLNEGDAQLTVLRIDPEFFDFILCMRSQDGGPPRPLSQWGEQYGLSAAINASMYLPDASTSTGYMRQGGHSNNKRVVQRFGAFFLAGPRAGSLPRAAILDRDQAGRLDMLDDYSLVIQNYRMINADRRILWSPGGPHYSISAVGQDGEGRILFLHCRQPVEAYAFAQQVLHLPLNVRTVMYVEGGGQAGLLVRSPALHREMHGLSAAGLLVTGDLKAMLPNVLGARRRDAPPVTPPVHVLPGEQAAPGAPAAPAEPAPHPEAGAAAPAGTAVATPDPAAVSGASPAETSGPPVKP